MTDDQHDDASADEQTPREDAPSSEDGSAGSDADEKVGEMEQGIERVDDDIEHAKEDAEKAHRLDPQPLTSDEDNESPSH
ncbi:MAG: hypothetical protein QOH48_620 [Actinomycetota bacterium]|jgi:hypothetical protein|nr:hypothetical protein [Actinomycetota bacterium]